MSESNVVHPHEQRVLEEFEQLRDRHEKLASFLLTTVYEGLDQSEKDRLIVQFEVMGLYRTVLVQRIEAMGHGSLIKRG